MYLLNPWLLVPEPDHYSTKLDRVSKQQYMNLIMYNFDFNLCQEFSTSHTSHSVETQVLALTIILLCMQVSWYHH